MDMYVFSGVILVFTCEIARTSDVAFDVYPIPDVAPELREVLSKKRRVRDRWATIIGRLLLLQALRAIGVRDVELGDLRSGEDGSPVAPYPLSCSISHTSELVAAAVAPFGSVGIDVESEELAKPFVAAAGARFSDSERCRLQGQEETFAYMWTRKEALAKAAGRSLDEVLGQSVLGDRLEFAGRTWHLRSRRLGLAHHCALAWDRHPDQLKVHSIDVASLLSVNANGP